MGRPIWASTVWDRYFMNMAKLASTNSKCRSRHVGAVLVSGKHPVAFGYNGPPTGMRPCDDRWLEDNLYDKYLPTPVEDGTDQRGQCPRRVLGLKSGTGLEYCVAGHAERNALLNAAKKGIATEGMTLYCYCGVPCKDCMVEIINAGVREVVCLVKSQDYDDTARVIAEECGILLREIEDRTMTFTEAGQDDQ